MWMTLPCVQIVHNDLHQVSIISKLLGERGIQVETNPLNREGLEKLFSAKQPMQTLKKN